MLHKLLFLLLIVSVQSNASTVFVGDSIAHGYKLYNNGKGITKVGANPYTVYGFVKNVKLDRSDTVVLSSGISNNCLMDKYVDRQLTYLDSKYVNIILLGNNNCAGASMKLRSSCNKYKRCTFQGIPPGPDGVHPFTYSKVF